MPSGKMKISQTLVCALLILPSLIFSAQTLPESQKDSIAKLIDDGWLEDAREQLLPLVEQYPKDASLRYQLARAGLGLGDYELADEQSRKCVDLVEDNVEFLLLRGDALGSLARSGGKVKAISRAKGCRNAYEKAVKLDPGSVEARESLMMFHMMAPGFAGGKRKEARKLATAISEINPMQGIFAQARVLHHLDDDSIGAREKYQKAVEEFGDDCEPYYKYAGYLNQQKESEEATRCFELAVERDDAPCEALMTMGGMLAKGGNYEEAIEIYERVLKFEPDRLSAKIRISKSCLKVEKYGRAHEVLSGVLKEDPDCAWALFQEGVLLYQQDKELPKAEANIRRYLNSRLNIAWDSRPAALYYLAKVLEKRGDYSKAWNTVKKASELAPYSSMLKEEVKKMEFMGSEN